MTAALEVLTRDNLHLSESKQAIGQDKMAATLAAIVDAIGLVLDRRDFPGADVPLRVDMGGLSATASNGFEGSNRGFPSN